MSLCSAKIVDLWRTEGPPRTEPPFAPPCPRNYLSSRWRYLDWYGLESPAATDFRYLRNLHDWLYRRRGILHHYLNKSFWWSIWNSPDLQCPISGALRMSILLLSCQSFQTPLQLSLHALLQKSASSNVSICKFYPLQYRPRSRSWTARRNGSSRRWSWTRLTRKLGQVNYWFGRWVMDLVYPFWDQKII